MIDLKNKKIVVMGLGLNQGGLGVAKWLIKHRFPFILTDLRSAKILHPSIKQLPKSKLITYHLGEHLDEDFNTADVVIANPAVLNNSPYLKLARKNQAKIINEAVLFFLLCPAKIIGITGTRGKSSTSWYLYQLLKRSGKSVYLTGNIAKDSFMQLVDKLKPNDLVVAELSSWHLELLEQYKLSPDFAIVTNIYRDHLNRYPSYKAYRQAKVAITKNQKNSDHLIINRVNQYSQEFVLASKAHKHLVSDLTNKYAAVIKLTGQHNLSNISLAIEAAKLVGVSDRQLIRALPKLKPLPWRQEQIRVYRGITIINDTAATAPEATSAAIQRFKAKPIILIAGGVDKNLNYSQLAGDIKKNVKQLILLPGSATDKLVRELRKRNYAKNRIIQTDSLKIAVTKSFKIAETGDYLIFSPGGASFNLFLNEFDRGRQFNYLIKHATNKK